MIIDNKLLDELSAKAKENSRLRQSMDFRNTPEDNSQRMLNALELGTVMPIHRHRGSSETVIVLRGKVRWRYYDDNGNETDSFIVEPQGQICGISVPIGQWHSLECLESQTVIFECKDGVYTPLDSSDIMNL